jgi:hypothetical protein
MLLFISVPGRAEDADFLELTKALPETAITLKDGLVLSDFAGRPISAEYELQGDLLLLFVVAGTKVGSLKSSSIVGLAHLSK